MGLFSGDVNLVTEHKKLKTAGQAVDCYDAKDGKKIGTMPAYTQLGECQQAIDGTTFFFGSWWLLFPSNNYVGQNFWIKFDENNIVNADDTQVHSDANDVIPTPVKDAAKGAADMFKGLANTLEIAAGIIAFGIVIYLFKNRKKFFK